MVSPPNRSNGPVEIPDPPSSIPSFRTPLHYKVGDNSQWYHLGLV